MAAAQLYRGEIEGDLADVLEDLLELWIEQPHLTRLDVGQTLFDYDLNNSTNLKTVLAELARLRVVVK